MMKHLCGVFYQAALAALVLLATGAVANEQIVTYPSSFAQRISDALARTQGEAAYVLYNDSVEILSAAEAPEQVLEACNFALRSGFDPEFPLFNVVYSVSKANLYSLQTQSAHGRVVKRRVNKVGESVVCTGDETADIIPAPSVYLAAPEFPNGPVSADVNQGLKIVLNGVTYYGSGSARFRTNASGVGLPYPGYFLVVGTATLHKVVAEPDPGWVVVGAYSSNIALPRPIDPAPEGTTGGLVAIRISPSGDFVPREVLVGAE